MHQLTTEYTPEQNGVAERFNRTLVEMARYMLIQAGLPPKFWAEAVMTSTYIRNRCPSRALNGNLPYTAWTKRKPTASHLQPFGKVTHVLNKSGKRGKFNQKTIRCIFIGYSPTSKANRLWDPESQKVIKNRDISFLDEFPNEVGEAVDEEDRDIISVGVLSPICARKRPETNQEDTGDEVESDSDDSADNFYSADSTDGAEQPESSDSDVLGFTPGPGRPITLRDGLPGRPRKIPHRIAVKASRERSNIVESNEIDTDNEEESEENVVARRMEDSGKDTITQNGEELAGLASTDPKSARIALTTPEADEWRAAMRNEFKALVKNETWIVVDRPQNRKVIEYRWVLRTKLNADESVERRKARLVAKEFTQRRYMDFDETFAPVARPKSIRLIMALAVKKGLEVHQLDFVSAYLNGEIEEELYLEIPDLLSSILSEKELKSFPNGKVLKLKKALYGLKQSGRQWFVKLDEKLKSIGFKQLGADNCVYLLQKRGDITIVIIYVDDVIIAANNSTRMSEIKRRLSSFEMKDLGKIHHCLGIRFNQTEYRITMDQQRYIEEILEKYDMTECKAVSTAVSTSVKLSKEMCPKSEDELKRVSKMPYRSLVGSLMYLAVSTRSDIAHAVSILGQFNNNYGEGPRNASFVTFKEQKAPS